jgi:transposase
MVEAERKRIAHQLLAEVRRLETELKGSRARLYEAVEASNTSLVGIYGVGPVVAGLLIGYTGDVSRFPTRHHFATYNGTAPIEASSGPRKRHRLNPRGNRMLNHALHLIAITQLRYPNTEGRVFYERKLAEGKTKKEAIRALKRRLSDVALRLVGSAWSAGGRLEFAGERNPSSRSGEAAARAACTLTRRSDGE